MQLGTALLPSTWLIFFIVTHFFLRAHHENSFSSGWGSRSKCRKWPKLRPETARWRKVPQKQPKQAKVPNRKLNQVENNVYWDLDTPSLTPAEADVRVCGKSDAVTFECDHMRSNSHICSVSHPFLTATQSSPFPPYS